jgi:hypothetical protein
MAATAIPRKGREPAKRVCCQNFQAPTMACIIALGGLFRPSPQAGQIFSDHDVSICSFNFLRYGDKKPVGFPSVTSMFSIVFTFDHQIESDLTSNKIRFKYYMCNFTFFTSVVACFA